MRLTASAKEKVSRLRRIHFARVVFEVKNIEKGFLTNKHATIDSAKIQQMSLISKCLKYQLLQNATDQEKEILCDVISTVGNP